MSVGRDRQRILWIVSRALSGLPLNGEVDRLEGDAKAAVKGALALPVGDARRKHIDAWLGGLEVDDANELRVGLLACDPNGPDPDAVSTAADLEGLLGQIEWLWPKWIAKGFVNLLVAEQESGKSLFAIWGIARSILMGNAWPDGAWPERDARSKVLWAEAEAGHQMLLERIKKARLPENRIIFPGSDPFWVPKLDNPLDVAELRETIRIHRPKILVYDALSGGHDKRENSSDEMLPVVRVLSDLARDFAIAVLLIHHVGKAIENGEINLRSIRGASGITQLCRTVMAIEKLDDQGWLRLRQIKNNIGRKPEPLGIRILESGLEYGAAPKPKKPETPIDEAKEFLLDMLADGKRRATDLFDLAEGRNIAIGTLKRAKKELGIHSFKDSFNDGFREGAMGPSCWWWALPARAELTEEAQADSYTDSRAPLR